MTETFLVENMSQSVAMKNLDKKFNTLWEDLNSIKNVDKGPKISNVLLYKELRRRIEIWKKEVAKVIFHANKTSAELGHNLFEYLVPEKVDWFKDFNEFRRSYLENTSISATRKVHDSLYVYYHIYWEIFKGEPRIKQFDYLPKPYSLIVDIITRGGSIYHVEMSFYSISGIEFSVKDKLKHPLPSIDDDFLNYIDERFGNNTSNIPNDEEIARLWNEFNSGNR